MKYYVASIHKGDPRTNNFEMIEHYYAVREDENIKDRIVTSLENFTDKDLVNKVAVYKYDFTMYDDELERLLQDRR